MSPLGVIFSTVNGGANLFGVGALEGVVVPVHRISGWCGNSSCVTRLRSNTLQQVRKPHHEVSAFANLPGSFGVLFRPAQLIEFTEKEFEVAGHQLQAKCRVLSCLQEIFFGNDVIVSHWPRFKICHFYLVYKGGEVSAWLEI
jgi:hypothetical protein